VAYNTTDYKGHMASIECVQICRSNTHKTKQPPLSRGLQTKQIPSSRYHHLPGIHRTRRLGAILAHKTQPGLYSFPGKDASVHGVGAGRTGRTGDGIDRAVELRAVHHRDGAVSGIGLGYAGIVGPTEIDQSSGATVPHSSATPPPNAPGSPLPFSSSRIESSWF